MEWLDGPDKDKEWVSVPVTEQAHGYWGEAWEADLQRINSRFRRGWPEVDNTTLNGNGLWTIGTIIPLTSDWYDKYG